MFARFFDSLVVDRRRLAGFRSWVLGADVDGLRGCLSWYEKRAGAGRSVRVYARVIRAELMRRGEVIA